MPLTSAVPTSNKHVPVYLKMLQRAVKIVRDAGPATVTIAQA